MNVALLISFKVVSPANTLFIADCRRELMPSSRAARLISEVAGGQSACREYYRRDPEVRGLQFGRENLFRCIPDSLLPGKNHMSHTFPDRAPTPSNTPVNDEWACGSWGRSYEPASGQGCS